MSRQQSGAPPSTAWPAAARHPSLSLVHAMVLCLSLSSFRQRRGAPSSPASQILTSTSFGGFSRRISVHGGWICGGGRWIFLWWLDPHVSAVARSMGVVTESTVDAWIHIDSSSESRFP
ncbi:hypothetical protein SORBI_3004G186400 [Sorghum bicolor]|uniref:Uncharacterized protein n=1 Tax=Sorghum bicolor TaxID=4558 RepID=A0A194YQJ7_SORBI|nr:hypothetical protein SORBI_3004G186400 [Sorghum bicolor]